MTAFDTELNSRLSALRKQDLYRSLRRIDSSQSPRLEIDGRTLLNFSSNDYLGLAAHPALKESAIKAVERYGVGAGASRLICGSLAPHHELDEALATFKATEAALSFSSGYAAAIGVIGALLGKDDCIIIDKLAHASMIDAARLCGAKLRVFAHNDLNDLERILKSADPEITHHSRITDHASRILIVTESVFSMDGDHAPLRELVELKEKYGVWLMVDEAHATGLYGPNRRGLAEELGVSERIEIQMGTLGKALGASGGYICGSRPLIDFLINRARTFIFSTAPVPAAAAAATAGIQLLKSSTGAERREMLWQHVSELDSKLETQKPKPPTAGGSGPLSPAEGERAGVRGSDCRGVKMCLPSAILPIVIGDEDRALKIAASLLDEGILIPAIRYPTVARGQARLRLTVSATHSAEDITTLSEILSRITHYASLTAPCPAPCTL